MNKLKLLRQCGGDSQAVKPSSGAKQCSNKQPTNTAALRRENAAQDGSRQTQQSVGRTGTFIAIDRIIFQIERESIADVFGITYEMRMHRPLMVQTEDQYVFLNQCALDVIKSRMGTNVDLIYQNTGAMDIYENLKPNLP
ncbi:receptor-type tyrosine-protein phosphatase eta-like [Clupea harengus]|uniref:Receptor-type tyrosine-protein phosphatase eta-like n=1 Tax=Clupea harengus TaxID=7950 RepID=A0A8M1KCQ6_CLUHA|nr:receptor-type tyrosine-protein phosphatase eta-like [Clupea harengus]